MWKFLACPSPGGGRPLDRFVEGLGFEAETNLTATLELLQAAERKLLYEFTVETGASEEASE